MIYSGPGWSLIRGDCRDVLAKFAENRFDSAVEDPPYELGFMGRTWDRSGVAFEVETWKAHLRVLKPGAYLVAFGGSRTFHRVACAIEDAGFELRDTLCWLYGSGFPKSLDVSAAIDKARQDDVRPVCRFLRAAMDAKGVSSAYLAGLFAFHPRMVDHWAARDTDSQPAVPTWEQWEKLRSKIGFGSEMDAEVLRLNGRKGTLGEAWLSRPIVGQHQKSSPGNLLRMGMLGDEQDPAGPVTVPVSDAARQWEGWGTALKPGWEPIILARKPLEGTVAENVRRWGTGGFNVDGCRVGSDVVGWGGGRGADDAGTWNGKTCGLQSGNPRPVAGRWPPNVILDEHAAQLLDEQAGERKSGAMHAGTYEGRDSNTYRPDAGRPLAEDIPPSSGGASRFFYCPKASKAERELGCEHLPMRAGGEVLGREDGSAGMSSSRAGAGRGGGRRNFHPTVKPIELMRWLVRLVTPPDGLVLDGFAGSGSTGVAALAEGFGFFGVEQSVEYVEIARARLEHATNNQAERK